MKYITVYSLFIVSCLIHFVIILGKTSHFLPVSFSSMPELSAGLFFNGFCFRSDWAYLGLFFSEVSTGKCYFCRT